MCSCVHVGKMKAQTRNYRYLWLDEVFFNLSSFGHFNLSYRLSVARRLRETIATNIPPRWGWFQK